MTGSADAQLQSFDPVVSTTDTLMILGSMPGVRSLDAQQYYAHPRNAFWKIIQSIDGGEIKTYKQKLQMLSRQRIALWDTLKHCQRPGSLDSNIASDSVVCNDFHWLFHQYPQIKTVAFNGKASEKWFKKLVLPTLKDSGSITWASLPSSSPAMATLSLAEKTTQWRRILPGPKS